MQTQDKPIPKPLPPSRRPEPPKVTRRWLIPALAGAAVVILAIVGAFVVFGGGNEPEVGSNSIRDLGPITSFEDIAGTAYELQDTATPSVFYFFEDGTWHVANLPERVEEFPLGILETRFEGTKVFLTNVKGACTGPSEAIYEIHLLENGNLRLVLIEDPCQFRANFFPGEWAPVP